MIPMAEASFPSTGSQVEHFQWNCTALRSGRPPAVWRCLSWLETLAAAQDTFSVHIWGQKRSELPMRRERGCGMTLSFDCDIEIHICAVDNFLERSVRKKGTAGLNAWCVAHAVPRSLEVAVTPVSCRNSFVLLRNIALGCLTTLAGHIQMTQRIIARELGDKYIHWKERTVPWFLFRQRQIIRDKW